MGSLSNYLQSFIHPFGGAGFLPSTAWYWVPVWFQCSKLYSYIFADRWLVAGDTDSKCCKKIFDHKSCVLWRDMEWLSWFVKHLLTLVLPSTDNDKRLPKKQQATTLTVAFQFMHPPQHHKRIKVLARLQEGPHIQSKIVLKSLRQRMWLQEEKPVTLS